MKSLNEKISKEFICFDNSKFYYYLIRKNIKNINIRIKSDKSIYVSCPINCKDKVIKEAILNKIYWINKQIDKIDNNEVKESYEFKNNSFVYFLGNKFCIKVIEKSINDNEIVIFKNNYVYIKVYKKYLNDNEYIERVFNKFCFEYAFNLYNSIAYKYVDEVFYKYINKSNLIVKLRKMKTKWGVCMPYKSKITINFFAIKLPLSCIEYIIFHELSHFVYHNHSKDFYNFIGKYMRDYKDRVKLINEKYKYVI